MSSKTQIAATKEEATPTLVPKLRFPGFSEPWAYDPLSKVLKEHKLKNTGGRDVFSVSMEHGIVNQIELLGRSYAAADTSHYTIGRRYDVVYTKSPLKAFPFGIVKQCKFDGEAALSPLYGVFTPTNPHLGLMIEAYFESPNRSKDFLSPLCQKGAKNTLQITNTTFLSGRLPLPTVFAEQQKIAECLSSVDELLAAQARKVDALKTHKKGLMQQLFPRAGETQPRLRFPEFQNSGEWEVKPLGELVELQSGYAFSSTYFGTEGRKLVTPKNFTKSGHGNFDESVSKYTTEEVPERFVCKPGDLLVLLTDLTPSCELLGKPLLLEEEDGTVLLNQRVVRVEASASKLTTRFLKYVFLSDAYSGLIIKTATGSTVRHSSNKVLLEMRLVHPSLPEQQRIAECLSSLDALITAETQKHEALKTHKRGLMQQLFPSPEEVAA